MTLDEWKSRFISALDDMDALAALQAEFVASGFVAQYLDEIIAAGINTDSGSIRHIGENTVRLIEHPRFLLHVERRAPSKKLLNSIAVDSFIHVISNGPVWLDIYDIEGVEDWTVFNPAARLVHASRQDVRDMQVRERRGQAIVMDYIAEAEFLTVELTLRPAMDYLWFFDRSGQALYPAFTSALLSGYELMAKAAAAVGETRLQPFLLELTHSSCHAIRWQAIQSLFRLAPELAVDCLKIAVNDPHPHVRRAADKALAKLAGVQA
ncbi:HEAT repeat domain-containing protein [Burkholderiaceae bacterium DAT-1]|nr:HEAT repeat domain-containing protein [Burkholderiaceae bacterium DAT-1]